MRRLLMGVLRKVVRNEFRVSMYAHMCQRYSIGCVMRVYVHSGLFPRMLYNQRQNPILC